MKLAITLFTPTLVTVILFGLLYNLSNGWQGLYTHDVCESHTHAALIPFISVLSVLLGFLPCLFYVAGLVYAPVVIPAEQVKEVEQIFTAVPGLSVGQVFENATCKLRVKALKFTDWVNADFSQFEYALNFSL